MSVKSTNNSNQGQNQGSNTEMKENKNNHKKITELHKTKTYLLDIRVLLFLLLDLQTLCIFGIDHLAIGGTHRSADDAASVIDAADIA